jgi:hypothetical protein
LGLTGFSYVIVLRRTGDGPADRHASDLAAPPRLARRATAIAAVAAVAGGGLFDVRPAAAQKNASSTFRRGQSNLPAKAPD